VNGIPRGSRHNLILYKPALVFERSLRSFELRRPLSHKARHVLPTTKITLMIRFLHRRIRHVSKVTTNRCQSLLKRINCILLSIYSNSPAGRIIWLLLGANNPRYLENVIKICRQKPKNYWPLLENTKIN
jgi:hypothetical protein